VWEDLVNLSSKTGIAVSPNEKILLTGTSVRKGYGYGFLVAVNTQTGEKVREAPISKHSVITVDWHHQINQIFMGSADATVKVLYDPDVSKNGILRGITRQERRNTADVGHVFGNAMTNYAEVEDEMYKKKEVLAHK